MKPNPFNVVTYPEDELGRSFIVQRLASRRAVTMAAPSIRALILRSYAKAYESPNGPLPIATVATRYGIENEVRYRETALRHHRKGSQYWVARTEGHRGATRPQSQGGHILGFVKTSPGNNNTIYVNDVVVDPYPRKGSGLSSQRRGYGSMLLHAALKYGGYDNLPLELEAFQHSEEGANRLYRNMGLVCVGEADAFLFPNGESLPMCTYRTPEGMALNGVVSAMERRNESLQQAYPSRLNGFA